MITGVGHVGIGVEDIDRSLKFYQDFLGFKNIVFDYVGPLPGMDRITRKHALKARTVMLSSDNVSPVAQGMIKLVQVLPPDKAERPKIRYEWGISEFLRLV